MARIKTQLNSMGSAYSKNNRDFYRGLIIEVDGDLINFEKSGYVTYIGYCKHRGIMRYGSE